MASLSGLLNFYKKLRDNTDNYATQFLTIYNWTMPPPPAVDIPAWLKNFAMNSSEALSSDQADAFVVLAEKVAFSIQNGAVVGAQWPILAASTTSACVPKYSPSFMGVASWMPVDPAYQLAKPLVEAHENGIAVDPNDLKKFRDYGPDLSKLIASLDPN